MDYYSYFWGMLKYYIPAILLIISIFIEPSILLLIIAIVWITISIFMGILLADEGQKKKSYS
jgi:uncharacterized membrane protein